MRSQVVFHTGYFEVFIAISYSASIEIPLNCLDVFKRIFHRRQANPDGGSPFSRGQMLLACASRYSSASPLHRPLWRAQISASAFISGSVLPRSAKSSMAVSGREICG